MGFNEILSAIQELPKADQVELIKQAIDIIQEDKKITPELLASLKASREELQKNPSNGVSAHDFLKDRMEKRSSMAFSSVLTPKAQRDIDRNWLYLEEQKNGLGHDFLFQIQECLFSLEDNPFLWQVIEDNFRRAIIKRFNFHLWYEVVD